MSKYLKPGWVLVLDEAERRGISKQAMFQLLDRHEIKTHKIRKLAVVSKSELRRLDKRQQAG